jgi:hypothetical protein
VEVLNRPLSGEPGHKFVARMDALPDILTQRECERLCQDSGVGIGEVVFGHRGRVSGYLEQIKNINSI